MFLQKGNFMSNCFHKLSFYLLFLSFGFTQLTANQTATTSPIHNEAELPFTVSIETADFAMPSGIHSGVSAVWNDKWLFFAGRTNGLHGFDPGIDNFPPLQQNSVVYVVDPKTKTISYKSLHDASSNLTQAQIDTLSVTSPQYYQDGKMLYITGGYGVNTADGTFSTKDALTAVNIPKLINWVLDSTNQPMKNSTIRQIFNPIFQVTGGYMTKNCDGLTLLIFGQNFEGFYQDSSNGVYLDLIERFYIQDDGRHLNFVQKKSLPEVKDPNYRRRDLNVLPIITEKNKNLKPSYVALSGVFTEDGGVWNVPVFIKQNGKASMANPSFADTFKQGMNHYVSATVSLFSARHSSQYAILLGGISYGFYQGGTFQTDPEIPFINQVTTIKIDNKKNCTQYLMNAEYPTIISTGVNPGNPFLFGAGSVFIPATNIKQYGNGVLKFDTLKKKKVLIGYIVGGIASTLPNTNTKADSTASAYIFKVYLQRR